MNSRNICLGAFGLACATLAHGQANVTIWGLVDVAAQHFSSSGTGTLNALGHSGYNSSQLGFRGVEDLGGGLRAGFWLEGGLAPDSGLGRPSNSNNQPSGASPATGGLTFDRRSYVSLGGSWGQVRLGRDFSPNHWNNPYFDAFNGNGVGRAGNFTFGGATAAPLPTTVVSSNSISYWLPEGLGGLYGVAMYAVGENASNATNPDDGNVKGLRLGWRSGPFDVAGAYARTDYASTATIGRYTHWNLGGSYKTGFGTLFALYNEVTVALAGGEVRKDTLSLGAHIPVTTTGRVRVSYTILDDRSAGSLRNTIGTARSDNDARQWAIGYVHDLSKRTALYGTYARLNNRGQANYAVSGGPAPTAGGASTGIELGLRHLF